MVNRERDSKRVLVVDDEPDIVRLISINLEMSGFAVVQAFNGEEALEKVKTTNPDCILLDVMMPGIDGWEVLRDIKGDEKTAAIPVIMVTAKTTDLDKLRGWGGGAVDYVTKPFNPGNLVVKVRKAIAETAAEEDEEGRKSIIKSLQLSTLYSITEAITSTLDLQEVLDTITSRMLSLLNADICAISLCEEDDGEFVLESIKSVDVLCEEDLRPASFKVEQFPKNDGRRLFLERQPLFLENPKEFPGADESPMFKRLSFIHIYPMVLRDHMTGVMIVGGSSYSGFVKEEIDLIETISSQATVAIANARLYENVKRDEEIHKYLLKRLLTVQEDERKKFAIELHDGVLQTMVSALFKTQAIETVLTKKGEDSELAEVLVEVKATIDDAINEMRRMLKGLRPAMLEELGLSSALRKLVDQFEEYYGMGMTVAIDEVFEESADDFFEKTLFRITQEALNNIGKHSGAKAASLSLKQRKGFVELEITDNGCGFDVRESLKRMENGDSFGLASMKERAEALGGRLHINSGSEKGTSIRVIAPMAMYR